MHEKTNVWADTRVWLGMLLVAGVPFAAGQSLAANPAKPVNAKKFDASATAALQVMKQKAAELNIQGVAVVSFASGEAMER